MYVHYVLAENIYICPCFIGFLCVFLRRFPEQTMPGTKLTMILRVASWSLKNWMKGTAAEHIHIYSYIDHIMI